MSQRKALGEKASIYIPALEQLYVIHLNADTGNPAPHIYRVKPLSQSGPKHNTLPMKIFFLVVSISLFFSNLTGLYRCTVHKGPCALPRFREQEIAERLGHVLKDVSISEEVVQSISTSLQRVHVQMRNNAAPERARLERELAALHTRMDAAYTDKLDGRISREFWQRKQADWENEELRIRSLISGPDEDNSGEKLLTVQRILELAQKPYFL